MACNHSLYRIIEIELKKIIMMDMKYYAPRQFLDAAKAAEAELLEAERLPQLPQHLLLLLKTIWRRL